MVVKNSLFYRVVFGIQTRYRSFTEWVVKFVPGLDNPIEYEREQKEKVRIDYWRFTFAEHKEIWKSSWDEYLKSFHPEDANADTIRGTVTDMTQQSIDKIKETIQGTNLEKNLREIHANTTANVDYLKKEVIDTEQVKKTVQDGLNFVQQTRSTKSAPQTLVDNIEELHKLAQVTKEKVVNLEKKDLDAFKEESQAWLMDKMLIGKDMMSEFVKGYQKAKKEELEKPEFGSDLLDTVKSKIDAFKETLKEDESSDTQRKDDSNRT